MNKLSAVSFPGKARIHVGLAVTDLAESITFYRTLLGKSPSKMRTGYAKFEVTEPSLNLSLNATDRATPLLPPTHFGIQVQSTADVVAAAHRLQEAGLETRIEENMSCCHAVQDKVWVKDPDGNAWEIYVVLDDNPDETVKTAEATVCCSPECCTQ